MRTIDSDKQNTAVSLIKVESRFIGAPILFHGGTQGALGRFFKTCADSEKAPKAYFLAKRSCYNEYFAIEIYNALGFSTPKIRYIKTNDKSIKSASKAIEAYIPLQAFYPYTNSFLKSTPEVETVRSNYRFNKEKQVIELNGTARTFKISGNLYAVNMAASLVWDSDLSGQAVNLGLVLDQGRFRAYFIDKEFAHFSKVASHEAFSKLNFYDLKPMFELQTKEQRLSAVYSIKKLITADPDTRRSVLQRIFFNARAASIYDNYLQMLFKAKFEFVVNEFIECFRLDETIKETDTIKSVCDAFKANLLSSFNAQFMAVDFKSENTLNNEAHISDYIKQLTDKSKQILRDVVTSNKDYAALKEHVFWRRYTKLEHASQTATPLEDFVINKIMDGYNAIEEGCTQEIRLNTLDCDFIEYPFDPVIMYNNTLSNAQLLIEHELNKDKDCFIEFERRERYRVQIANKVMQSLSETVKKSEKIPKNLCVDLVEDLRGPYYQKLFLNKESISAADVDNKALIEQICNETLDLGLDIARPLASM